MAPQGYSGGNWANWKSNVVPAKSVRKQLPLFSTNSNEHGTKRQRSPTGRASGKDKLSLRLQLWLLYHSFMGKKAAFSVPRVVLWCALLLLAVFFTFAVWLSHCEQDQCKVLVIKIAMFVSLPQSVFRVLSPNVGVLNGKADVRVEHFSPEAKAEVMKYALHYYNPELNVKTRSSSNRTFPPMNIAIVLIGSLGDVQPFVPVAKQLQAMGHRVRMATHAQFRPQIMSQGLEFYPLGGDPKYFVDHLREANWYFSLNYWSTIKFLFLGLDTERTIWPALTHPDVASGGKPFKADFLITSSINFGYEIFAEILQIPIHAVSVFPTAPTAEAPCSTIERRPEWSDQENRMTYAVYDATPWVTLHRMMNIGLRLSGMKPVPLVRQQILVPHTFLYSTDVLPRFSDWGDHIDVVGSGYVPVQEGFVPAPVLADFLAAGPPPIFVGFGSMVSSNPRTLTLTLIQALVQAGERGIIQRGWARLGLGVEPHEIPSTILIVDYVPHEWLLRRCKAVIHHGGSGTLAAGLRAGLPTQAVTFILDQPFWGRRIYELGIGPRHIPVQELTVPKLVEGIKYLRRPEVKAAAVELGKKVAAQNGALTAVNSIIAHIPDEFVAGVPCMPWKHATDPTSPSYGQWTC